MYNAYIAKIRVSKHPNADRLNIGTVLGEQVIVGKETKDGEIVVYFPCDGQLSEEYAKANDLIARKDKDGKRAGGFFRENRRVVAQTLRGERSNGFVASLDSLSVAGVSDNVLASLKEGDCFCELDGVKICNKYETPATVKKRLNTSNNQSREHLLRDIIFPRHIDTKHIMRDMCKIKTPCLVTVSEKLHGTSARYGLVPVRKRRRRGFFKRLFNKPADEFVEFEYHSGSRNVLLGGGRDFHGDDWYRLKCMDGVWPNMHSGMVIYGEIVGHANGKPIMGSHGTVKMPMAYQERFGRRVDFSYGNQPGDCSFYVYRISSVSEDGTEVDYNFMQVQKIAESLGLKTVPLIGMFEAVDSVDMLAEVTVLTEVLDREEYVGCSALCRNTPVEGLVFRIDNEDGVSFYKHKSYNFKLLEGIIKSRDDYADEEEAS